MMSVKAERMSLMLPVIFGFSQHFFFLQTKLSVSHTIKLLIVRKQTLLDGPPAMQTDDLGGKPVSHTLK